MDYRKKIPFKIVKFRRPFSPEDRGLKECCCEIIVCADVNNSDMHRNDVTGVYDKKSLSSDTIEFSITKCGSNDDLDLLGTVATFPQEPLGIGFIFDWRQYLQTYGVGEYTIRVNTNISGLPGEYVWGRYTLIPYNAKRLNGTVRIWSEFDSYHLKRDFNFTGSNFKDSLRFPGLFGERKLNSVIENLNDINRVEVKTTTEYFDVYALEADNLTECVSERLIDFHLLAQDRCFMSDHNKLNHTYKYLHFPVSLTQAETEYYRGSRKMKVTAEFNDRRPINKSFYDVNL